MKGRNRAIATWIGANWLAILLTILSVGSLAILVAVSKGIAGAIESVPETAAEAVVAADMHLPGTTEDPWWDPSSWSIWSVFRSDDDTADETGEVTP